MTITSRPWDTRWSVSITLAEIFYGIEKSAIKKKERRLKIEHICSQLEIFTFDELAASSYGFVRAQLEKNGMPISERDLQIASIALANDFTLTLQKSEGFRAKASRVKL